MRSKSMMTASLAVSTLLVSVACSRSPDRSSQLHQNASQPVATPAISSWVTVHENYWIPAIDALGGHLYEADRAFESGSNQKAAQELHGAAARLKEEAAEAADEPKEQLEMAAADIEAVANDLDRGVPVTDDRLDDILNRAWEVDVQYSWISRDTEDWEPFAREPDRDLELSLARFEDGNPTVSIEMLRKAAAILKMESARGMTVADKEELVSARMDLREVANEIESGELADVSRLENVIARAAHTLARHHQLLAEHEYQVDHPLAAGRALDVAVSYLERAYEWSGTPIKPATEAVLAAARAQAEDTEMEEQSAAENIDARIQAVASEIQSLAATVEPKSLRQETG